MKVVATLLMGLALTGCTSNSSVTPSATSSVTPSPGNSTALLWAMVVENSGVCISGASVEVVSGQGAGQIFAQATPCDAWSADGGVMLRNLTPGLTMRLRSSAPGYTPQEKTVVTSSGPQVALLFTPSRQ